MKKIILIIFLLSFSFLQLTAAACSQADLTDDPCCETTDLTKKNQTLSDCNHCHSCCPFYLHSVVDTSEIIQTNIESLSFSSNYSKDYIKPIYKPPQTTRSV